MKSLIAGAFGIALLAVGGMATAQPPTTDAEPPVSSRPRAQKTDLPPDLTPARPSGPLAPRNTDPDRFEQPVALPPQPATPTRILPSNRIPAVGPTPVVMDFGMPLQVAQAAPKPDDMTIDQLLEAVENLRAQKAEMEKREQAMLKVLRQKAEKMNQRIGNLGGGQPPMPTEVAPVGGMYPNQSK